MVWMLYCDTTALRAVRLMSAMAPSVCDCAPLAVIGRLRNVLSESICTAASA